MKPINDGLLYFIFGKPATIKNTDKNTGIEPPSIIVPIPSIKLPDKPTSIRVLGEVNVDGNCAIIKSIIEVNNINASIEI